MDLMMAKHALATINNAYEDPLVSELALDERAIESP